MEVRVAQSRKHWSDAADLLFCYHRETAVEVGADAPGCPEDVWLPVRGEATDPASVFNTYLVAYQSDHPVGGVALVAHDARSVMLKRCFVRPEWRRRGIAKALSQAADQEAAQRGVGRLVLDILPSRQGGIAAWRRMGFAEAEPWGDASMVYFERLVGDGRRRTWLGLYRGEVVLSDGDARWVSVFEHQAEVLRQALGERVIAIEHVGSTAVEGLVAKPIVDVAVRLAPDADEDSVVGSLENRGYEFRGDKEQAGGLLFVLDDQPRHRITHVHLVRDGDHDGQWKRYLTVRDQLRTDAIARTAHAARKCDLARRFPSDRGSYTAARASVVEQLLRIAVDGSGHR